MSSALDQQAAVVLWAGFNSRTVTITNVAAGASIIVQNSMFNFGVTGAGSTLGCTTVNDGSAYSNIGPSATILRANGGASGGWLAEETWYLHNASAGTHSIVLTSNLANSNNYGQIKVHSVTAVQNAIPDISQPNATTSATLTTGNSASPSQSGMWLVAGLGVSTNLSSPSWTNPATGFTALSYDPTTAHGPAEFDYQHITSTSAQVAAWGTNSAGSEAFVALLVGFKDVVAGGAPTITSVIQSGQTAGTIQQNATITITGTNLGSNTGSAAVTLIDGSNSGLTSTCSITSWGSTSIVCTVTSGNVRNGSITSRVTTSGGLTATFGVTLTPATGISYGTFSTPKALTTNVNGSPSRLTDSPDIASGQQWEMPSTVTVITDGNITWPVAVSNITWRHHDGAQWNAVHWDLRGPFPTALSIPTQTGVNGSALTWDFSGSFAETDPVALPLTYTVSAGMLPTGLTLGSSTGKVTGTPSVTVTQSGIVLRTTNAEGSYVEAAGFPATIAASANVSFSGSIPDITTLVVNAPPNPIDVLSFFTNATSFTVTTGTLPPGMILNGSAINGTPTGVGINPGFSANYVIVITGSNAVPSSAASNSITLTVTNPAIVVLPPPVVIPAVKSVQILYEESANTVNTYFLNEGFGSNVIGSSDSVGKVYRAFRIPAAARVTQLQIQNESISGGLYKIGVSLPSDGSVVIAGSDGIFVPALNLSTTRIAWTDFLLPGVIGQTNSLANVGKRVWELLGLTSDPSPAGKDIYYDVILTVVTPSTTGGVVNIRALGRLISSLRVP